MRKKSSSVPVVRPSTFRIAFDTVPAVVSGRVLAADDDVASRWGPRIADFAESVAATLKG